MVVLIPLGKFIMNKHRLSSMIEMCRVLAQDIEGRDFRHVSVILNKNKIIAVGTNIRKSHPDAIAKGYRYDEPHSELRAFSKVPYSLRNSNLTLVNFRFNRQGVLRIAKPCSKCQIWCDNIFRHIYWSTDSGKIIKQ